MKVVSTSTEISEVVKQFRKAGKTIGLVPTMGALHLGHETLIKRSVTDNNITIVSIFVNPLQFNNPDDLINYPNTLTEDIEKIGGLNGDIVFCPTVDEMYPEKPNVKLDFGHLTEVMEGKFRPGHFNGVGIVVMKFFNQVCPDRAYFGLKDFQQFMLAQEIVKAFSYRIKIIGVPIVREGSGLAMSSRNLKLSSDGKNIASNIYQGLTLCRELINSGIGIQETRKRTKAFYASIDGLTIEYLEIVDAFTLNAPKKIGNSTLIACAAAYVEGVRLIDNLYLQDD